MKARLACDDGAHGKTVGEVNVPDDTTVIVVNDTAGYANDVFVYSEEHDAFMYQPSVWVGTNETKPKYRHLSHVLVKRGK